MRWLPLVFVFASCGEERPKHGPPPPVAIAPKPAPPAVAPTLEATLDGTPLTFASVYAFASRTGLITVVASSIKLTCEQAANRGGWKPVDDPVSVSVLFELGVRRQLRPDGSLAPYVQWSQYSGYRDNSTRATTLSGDGKPGEVTRVHVDFTHAGAGSKQTLRINGTLEAIGCPFVEPAALPLPREQPASITIAGTTMPVRFATFVLPGEDAIYGSPTLWLYTGSESCRDWRDGDTPSPFVVAFEWLNAGDPDVSAMGLHGTLTGNYTSGVADPERVRVKPRPAGKGRIRLDVDTTLVGFPVKIAGTIDVVPCKKPP